MSEIWSYSLSDLLLFSPRVYHRLIELHNHALWPAQVLAIILGLTLIYLVARRSPAHGRMILTICGAIWLWVAWSFFWERYATINWAANYMAPIAALEGLLLIGAGLARRHLDFAQPRGATVTAAVGILAFAIVGYPFIASVMGRSWSAAEIFGITPDPTAVATVALLALANGRIKWLLMLIPVLWCVTTGLTLWIMAADDFFIAPMCALAAVVIALRHARCKRIAAL